MMDFENCLEKTKEVGKIISIDQSIIKVSGLPGLKLEEMVITEEEARGIAFGIDEELAEILMFETEKLKLGERVARANEPLKIPINENVLGRIVDPLCHPIDSLIPIEGKKEFLEIKREAPSILERKRIKRFLETGVAIVDLLVPVGYGQRELVIGDGKTGKTTFLLQTFLSQVKKGVICVYVFIGKEIAQVKSVEAYLKKMGIFEKTVLVVAAPNSPLATIYLAPYSGMTIAEYFRDKGKDTIIVFDDLTTHAKIYREISSILRRTPGRSAYPGDIFYIQATLMERAGNIQKEGKEVSITAFPVAETLENDLSGYIQTNLMAMTDGHIFFDVEEFKKGKRPAINAFLSVSRVGNQTKSLLDQELARLTRKKMIEYQQSQEIAQFGMELPEKTQKAIDFGEKLKILFNQDPETVISREFQLFLLGLLFSGAWDRISPKIVKMLYEQLLNLYKKNFFSEVEKEIKNLKNIQELKNLSIRIYTSIKKQIY